jgi:predicted metal-dependent phosphoesterase TrpH
VVIDLHAHTTRSDGTDSPTRLVERAAAQGVDVLGLTDHDTFDAWTEAAAALPPGMTLVPGVEVSAVWHEEDARISVHILGYVPDPTNPALSGALARLRESRSRRGRIIVDRLIDAGYPITWPQVRDLAAGGAVGRPHIAQALVVASVVDSVSGAFAGLLNSASPYYVHKDDIPALEAVALIEAAGGVSALAHSLARRRGAVIGDADIAALAAAGLAAVEVDHPDHSPEDRAHLAGVATDLGLIRLGSSDYHGANKPIPLAACTTTPEAYDALVARARPRTVVG